MITVTDTCTFDEETLHEAGADPGSCLFFDIETTGFKPASSSVYLIGVSFRSGDAWRLVQWMSETPDEEDLLLRLFRQTALRFSCLVHFNGDRFDIPYLTEKYALHAVPSPFPSLASIDLYREAARLRRFLGLSHINQKAMEQFLGVEREDVFSGGDLIRIYHDFTRTGDSEKRRLLLLHNRDDVVGMTQLTRLYTFSKLYDRMLFLAGLPRENPAEISRALFPKLSISFTDADLIPVPSPETAAFLHLRWETGQAPCSGFRKVCRDAALSLYEKTAVLSVPLLHRELRFFFDNYKDYYYLPAEDEAIHKSVASFVDKAFRVKAKAETCYVRRSGIFLPLFSPVMAPVFKESYRSKEQFFLPDQDFFKDDRALPLYLCSCLEAFL